MYTQTGKKHILNYLTRPPNSVSALFQFLPRPIFSSVSTLFQFLLPCFIYPVVFFFHSIAEGALIATMIKGRPNSFLSLIFLLSALHGFLSVHSFLDEWKQDEPMRLELIHRYSPQLHGHVLPDQKPKTQLELIKELHRHDVIRHQMISRKRQHHQIQRRNALETACSASVAMPLSSAWDSGVGQYLVQVRVGTPSQRFMLIADTGSDLTWMKCKYRCGEKCGLRRAKLKKNKKKVFRANQSTTFKTVPCSSEMCKFELDFSRKMCPTPLSPCKYDYR